MAEDTKNSNESHEENQPENVDNRLPYEKPKLRKHGKINDATTNAVVPEHFDTVLGLGFADIS